MEEDGQPRGGWHGSMDPCGSLWLAPYHGPSCLPSHGPRANSVDPRSIHPLLGPSPLDPVGMSPQCYCSASPGRTTCPLLGETPCGWGGGRVPPITASSDLTSERDRQLQAGQSGPVPQAPATHQAQRKFPISPSPHSCPATAFPLQPRAGLVSPLLKPKSLTSFLEHDPTGNPLILTSKAITPPPWTSSITPVRPGQKH